MLQFARGVPLLAHAKDTLSGVVTGRPHTHYIFKTCSKDFRKALSKTESAEA